MTGRALVTGAAGHIGRAIVGRLERDGWDVVGLDVTPCDDAAGAFVRCDLADGHATLRAVEDVARTGLELLVNNAAYQPSGSVLDGTVDDWDDAFKVNVRAAFLTIKAAAPALQRSRGAVVNVGSVHARATSPGRVAYVASKAALSGLTRAAALELAPSGVRVNAVLPGAVDTPMLDAGLGATGTSRAELQARLPLEDIGTPEDVAAAVAWLAGPDALRVTGQEFVIDGGALARLSTE